MDLSQTRMYTPGKAQESYGRTVFSNVIRGQNNDFPHLFSVNVRFDNSLQMTYFKLKGIIAFYKVWLLSFYNQVAFKVNVG